MKRVLLMMAAAVSVATAMAPATPALARDGDRERRAERQERARPAADRDGPARGQPQRSRQDAAPQDPRARRYDAPPSRRDEGDRPRYDERPRYEPAPRPNYMSPAPGVAARRGYAPDSYRGGGPMGGGVVDDYRRYRLRPPPQGYDWVRMGNGFALVERGSGRIFDRVN